MYFNACSVLGVNWFKNGYIQEYNIIHNMPYDLINFGFLPKDKENKFNKFILYNDWKKNSETFVLNANEKFQFEWDETIQSMKQIKDFFNS